MRATARLTFVGAIENPIYIRRKFREELLARRPRILTPKYKLDVHLITGCKKTPDFANSYVKSPAHRKAESPGRYKRHGDTGIPRIPGRMKKVGIRARQQGVLSVSASVPNRADGMKDMPRIQVKGAGKHAIAALDRSRLKACCLNPVEACTFSNRKAYAACYKQIFVCGNHNAVDSRIRNVAGDKRERHSELQESLQGNLDRTGEV